jgi:predicted component of type VI protein secretion system
MHRDEGSVRLVLEEGTSRCLEKCFVPGSGQAQLTVGSSALCDWRVHARGVRSRHMRLFFNGKVLRVEDQHAPGAVQIEGRPVAHRFGIVASTRLRIGAAVIRVEWPEARVSEGAGSTGLDPGAAPSDETRAGSGDEVLPEATLIGSVEESPETIAATVAMPTAPRGRRRPRTLLLAGVAVAGGVFAITFFWSAADRGRAGSARGLASASAVADLPAPAAEPVVIAPLVEEVDADEGTDVDPTEAAEHLAQGRTTAALAAFRRLASRHPEDTLYQDVVRLLERQVGQRCARAGGGAACAAL